MKQCSKCGGTRFNSWDRCMDCRNDRAKVRQLRIKANGGSHTAREWAELLAASPTCAICARPWHAIPSRPDSRYKHTWTKGHKIPVYHGGSDSISNIQAECYECNFRQNAGKLGRAEPIHKGVIVAADQSRFSRAFSFVLNNGKEVFPVQMKRQDTGAVAYRVSRGGTGGNTLESGEEVDEPTMIRKVIDLGYAVRCSSLDGNTKGLYKPGHRSVREVRRKAT